ncbi:MAG: VCBS repeat-containing protein [Myxococcota bacterium]
MGRCCAITIVLIGGLAGSGCSAERTGDAGAADASPDANGGMDATTFPDAGNACAVRCGPANICCDESEECVRDMCLPRCEGSRCGTSDELCCTGEELCLGASCVLPGAPCVDEGDCGEDETCEPLVQRCVPIPPDSVCRYVPPTGVFQPEVQWHYSAENALTIPLVIQVTDDNGDGAINGADVPDVVTLTYPATQQEAHLTALSGDDGRVHWTSPASLALCGGAPPAAGDLDGDGTVEIVVTMANDGRCGSPGQRIAAFSHTGTLEWMSSTTVESRYGAAAIADLDADGSPEIVVGGAVFSSDGTVRWRAADLAHVLNSLAADAPTIADLDGDGQMEVIASTVAYRADGSVLWRRGSVGRGYTAVGRLISSGPPGPQIVAINQTMLEILDGRTGATLLGPVTYESRGGSLAGAPTIADFDGDGRPEIGAAGEHRYIVFDPDIAEPPHILWSIPSEDASTGSVGSTVFDFEADGSAEVIYADECHVRILSGRDGSVLWHESNTSVTTFEYPVVADVDGDGNSELVVPSNSSTLNCENRSLPFSGATQGIRVFRDVLDNWVPTRALWNQHTYHIDNVRDDGTIPTRETASWTTHNSYRRNNLANPDAVTLAPDLVIVSADARVDGCPSRATLRARVENRGGRGVPAGVPVAFFAGTPPDRSQLLAVGTTARPILAGAGEWVEAMATMLPLDAMNFLRFYAVADDDGLGTSAHSECVESNNVGEPISFDCSGPM